MNNSLAVIRSLVIYGVCLPLAIYLGYLLATPENRDSLVFAGAILGVLLIPIVLNWHHPLLVVSWNASAVVFFSPGEPPLWLAMAAAAFGMAIFRRALNRGTKFLSAWSVTWPLLFLLVVVMATAKLTGGIGMRLGGGDMYGGKRYLFIVGAVIGFFALISRETPLKLARRYVGYFFLSGMTAVISILVVFVPSWLYWIFWIVPADVYGIQALMSASSAFSGDELTRLGGLGVAGQAAFSVILAFFGVEKLLTLRRAGWLMVLLATFLISLYAGFRSSVIQLVGTFALIFWLEGLVRTRWLPVFAGLLITVCLAVLPFVQELPKSVQRSLSILPIKIDPVAAADAQYSTEWRLRMWRQMWPEVPNYLLLGKGYSINSRDLEFAQTATQWGGDNIEVALLAGDYHSGPLSVLIPFGAAGAVGFIWFLVAAVRALHRNRRYGDPQLRTINNFLFVCFIVRGFFFFGIYGSLYTDLFFFTGLVGLSISLNGGIRGPARATQTNYVPAVRLRQPRAAH